MTNRAAQIGGFGVLTLVLLRLVVGWHFFAEGREKVVYEPAERQVRVTFSAEGFLRQAKGPVVPVVQFLLPTNHDWEVLLAVSRENIALTQEQAQETGDWTADYARRQTETEKTGAMFPAEIPPHQATSQWGREVLDDWKTNRDALLATAKMTDDQRQKIIEIYATRSHQLADYLAGEESAIADYRHQLWRLDQWKRDPAAGELPYLDERIADKERETSADVIQWVNQVRTIETDYTDDLRAVLTSEQMTEAATAAALVDPKQRTLNWINHGVTWLVLGVGALLIVGFFTRLASLAGALFLISVMATQPPWVAGATDTYFWYQLVELAALGVLFGTRAGRWLGMDFFTYALFHRSTDSYQPQRAQSTPRRI